MHIQILGINHQIQRCTIGSWGSDGEPQAFEKDQKDRFTQLIQERVSQRQVSLVCEETRHGEVSLAEAVCQADGQSYCNIEMTPEERTRRGIPGGYNEDSSVSDDDKGRWNQERENDMFARIEAEASGHNQLLVICGRAHSEPLATRLCAAGHSVEIDDLQNQVWYIEDWQHHILYNL